MSDKILNLHTSRDVEADVARAAAALEAGQLVVLPTETVYGVAGRLDVPATRERLAARRGPVAKAWTLHLADPQQAWDYVTPEGDLPRRLVKKLWPGPVGLIFDVPTDRQQSLCERFGVTPDQLFDNGTLTLRCPDHAVFSEIVGRLTVPVVLTQFDGGHASIPASLDVEAAGVDLVVDAGQTRFSKASTLLRVYPDRYEIVRAGVFDQRIIDRQLRTTVLFVCSGNTCRSPMAEALARKILAKSLGGEAEVEAKGFTVASAGVFAMNGTRATPQAVEAVASMGADLSKHRSQSLTPELLHGADVVFVMGQSHAQAARVMSHTADVVTLDPDGDIEDPIGSDVATYKHLAEQMEKLIQRQFNDHKILG